MDCSQRRDDGRAPPGAAGIELGEAPTPGAPLHYRGLMRYVCLGEALIDLVPVERESSAESTWRAHSGGSPMNTAVALSRLGQDVAFLGRLSDDMFGRQLADHLEANGVSLELAVRTPDPTLLAVVSVDEEGVASYAFHMHGTTIANWHPEDFPTLLEEDWLHFGSINAVVEPGYGLLRDFLGRVPCRMSFDLNVRPSVLPDRDAYRRKIDELLSIVGASGGIGKASDADLVWLDGDAEPLETARRYVEAHDLDLFIVTLGADGAAAVGREGVVARVPGHRIDLVDTVGAGDTFMAGFLSGYRDGDVERALTRGAGASALVCMRHGAQPPSAEELEAFLA